MGGWGADESSSLKCFSVEIEDSAFRVGLGSKCCVGKASGLVGFPVECDGDGDGMIICEHLFEFVLSGFKRNISKINASCLHRSLLEERKV